MEIFIIKVNKDINYNLREVIKNGQKSNYSSDIVFHNPWFRVNIRRKDHDGNCICYCSTDIVCSHIHGNILCMDNIHSPLVIRYI